MSVIVDDSDSASFALELEAAIRVLEVRQSISDFIKRNTKLKSDRNTCESVVNVVLAGHRKVDPAKYIRANPNRKTRAELVVELDVVRRDVGLRRKSVSYAA